MTTHSNLRNDRQSLYRVLEDREGMTKYSLQSPDL